MSSGTNSSSRSPRTSANMMSVSSILKNPKNSSNSSYSSGGGVKSNAESKTFSVDSQDSLLFPKRDVSTLPTNRSTSSFVNKASALKKHHRKIHHHHYNHRKDDPNVLGTSCDCPCPSPPQSPVLHANEHVRIRTPASAVPSRHNSLEIGTRMPFNDKPGTPTDKSTTAEPFFQEKSKSKEPRHYEIARVVMSTPSSPTHHTSQGSQVQIMPSNSFTQLLPLRSRSSYTELKTPEISHSDLSSAASLKTVQQSPLKQIHEPRQPLYIPAVLRPTAKASYQIQRHQTVVPNSRKCSMHPPRRDHWAADHSTSSCTACQKEFGFLERRHHCRKCGEIFCASDSRFRIGLDQNLDYNLFGFPSRACRACWEDFTQSILHSSRLSTDPTPVSATCGSQGITIGQRLNEQQSEQQPVAGSLVPNMPVDWSWSTF